MIVMMIIVIYYYSIPKKKYPFFRKKNTMELPWAPPCEEPARDSLMDGLALSSCGVSGQNIAQRTRTGEIHHEDGGRAWDSAGDSIVRYRY